MKKWGGARCPGVPAGGERGRFGAGLDEGRVLLRPLSWPDAE